MQRSVPMKKQMFPGPTSLVCESPRLFDLNEGGNCPPCPPCPLSKLHTLHVLLVCSSTQAQLGNKQHQYSPRREQGDDGQKTQQYFSVSSPSQSELCYNQTVCQCVGSVSESVIQRTSQSVACVVSTGWFASVEQGSPFIQSIHSSARADRHCPVHLWSFPADSGHRELTDRRITNCSERQERLSASSTVTATLETPKATNNENNYMQTNQRCTRMTKN